MTLQRSTHAIFHFRRLGTSLSGLVVFCIILAGCDFFPSVNPAPTPLSAPTYVFSGTPTPIIAPLPNSNGAMDRANVQGTGVYDTQGVLHAPGVLWTHLLRSLPPVSNTATLNGRTGSTPAVVNGTLYVGEADDYLLALDAKTGAEKWKFRTANGSVNSPSVADGIVYFASGDETLRALNADTGMELWRFTLPPLPAGDTIWTGSFFTNPIVVGDTVFVGNERNVVFALDAKTGKVKWFKEVSASVEYAPVVGAGVVYFGTASGSNVKPTVNTFYGLDAVTGREIWRAPLQHNIIGSPTVVDGSIYVVLLDSGLIAFDALTGQVKWNSGKPLGVIGISPAVAYNTIFVSTVSDSNTHGPLYAFDSGTGQEKWHFAKDENSFIDPVIADGLVYCITFKVTGNAHIGHAYALSAQTGQEIWAFTTSGSFDSAPVVADGVLYFRDESGYLYALR